MTDLIANPEDFPTVDFTPYNKEKEDIEKYTLQLKNIKEDIPKLSNDLSHVLDILAKYNVVYLDLIPIYVQAWETYQTQPDLFNDIGLHDDTRPNWMYDICLSEAPTLLRPLLKSWNEKAEKFRLNFLGLFTVLKEIVQGPDFNQMGKRLLLKEQTTLERRLNSSLERLDEIIIKKNRAMTLLQGLNSGEIKWEDLTQPNMGVFSHAYTDKLSVEAMESMFEAIKSTPGAVKWFKTYNELDINHPMVTKLLNHPKVSEYGHSGMTGHWTLHQFDTIFQRGWNFWITSALLSTGVGWDRVTFDEALNYQNQKCAIYLFDQADPTKFKYYIDQAVEMKMEKLLSLLLDKFESHISQEDYLLMARETYEENLWSMFHDIMSRWDRLYSRVITITGINLVPFIRDLWTEQKHGYSGKSSPSEDEVREFISEKGSYLNGKNIHIDWKESTLDPFYYPDMSVVQKLSQLHR